VRAYRPTIALIVDEQVEHLLQQETSADLTYHFAEPLSASVHCHILGLDRSALPAFTETFLMPSRMQDKFDFVRKVLKEKRQYLGDDVLSDLLRSELEPAEVEGLTFMLMTSGRDSVAYMIVTSLLALLTHPQQMEKLRRNPSLVDEAVEECVRFGTMFVTLFPRTATETVVLAGTTIQQGETVSVSAVAANRDPMRFPRPDDFDVSRDAYGHMGFGHGIHACIGQQLARAEISEAIRQATIKMPNLRVVDAEQLRPQSFASDFGTYGAGALMVAW